MSKENSQGVAGFKLKRKTKPPARHRSALEQWNLKDIRTKKMISKRRLNNDGSHMINTIKTLKKKAEEIKSINGHIVIYVYSLML